MSTTSSDRAAGLDLEAHGSSTPADWLAAMPDVVARLESGRKPVSTP